MYAERVIFQRTFPGEIFQTQQALKLRMNAALELQMSFQVLFPETAFVRPTTLIRTHGHGGHETCS